MKDLEVPCKAEGMDDVFTENSDECLILGVIFLFFSFSFWPLCTAYQILVPQSGIEPMPPAVEVQSLNHCTTREVSDFRIVSHKVLKSILRTSLVVQ